jgi:hypothetical protein
MAIAREEKPWVQVFLEIALRAIRRVHLEYGIWGGGRQWKMEGQRAAAINMGHGIELADERTVCAAISQEFMTSPSVTGDGATCDFSALTVSNGTKISAQQAAPFLSISCSKNTNKPALRDLRSRSPGPTSRPSVLGYGVRILQRAELQRVHVKPI